MCLVIMNINSVISAIKPVQAVTLLTFIRTESFLNPDRKTDYPD
jgi:hypothetical protein